MGSCFYKDSELARMCGTTDKKSFPLLGYAALAGRDLLAMASAFTIPPVLSQASGSPPEDCPLILRSSLFQPRQFPLKVPVVRTSRLLLRRACPEALHKILPRCVKHPAGIVRHAKLMNAPAISLVTWKAHHLNQLPILGLVVGDVSGGRPNGASAVSSHSPLPLQQARPQLWPAFEGASRFHPNPFRCRS